MTKIGRARPFVPRALIGAVLSVCASMVLRTPGAEAAAELKPVVQKPIPAEMILTYSGAERQTLLEEGARKEGKVVWLATLNPETRDRITAAFKLKYPFVNFETARVETVELLKRVVEEYRARKHDIDLVEVSYPGAVGLKMAGNLAKFSSPVLQAIPAAAIDPDRYFFADRENPLAIGFNTNLVPESTAPTTYDDLLNPGWRGKLSTQNNAQAVQYFGALSHLKGEEYLRKLAQQGFALQDGAAREVAQLVAAGKVMMMMPVSISHPLALQKKGAPIAYRVLEPAPTAAGYVAALNQAPHPHATALLMDFILSDPGQQIMTDNGSGAVRKGIANPYPDFKKLYIDFLVPQNQYEAEYKKWSDLHQSLFVKRASLAK
jgi:iron(III) transport system substrate-binding protein